jgi:hypothetical protein
VKLQLQPLVQEPQPQLEVQQLHRLKKPLHLEKPHLK